MAIQHYPIGVTVAPESEKGLTGGQPALPNYNQSNRNPLFLYMSNYGANEQLINKIDNNNTKFSNLDLQWKDYCYNSITEPVISAGVPDNRLYKWKSMRTGRTNFVAFGSKVNKDITISFYVINYTKYGYRPAENMIYYLEELFRTKILEIENNYINFHLRTKFIAINRWKTGNNLNPNAIPITISATTYYENDS